MAWPEFGFHSRSGVADDDFDDAIDFAQRYRHVLAGHGLAQAAGELRVRGLAAQVPHFDPVLLGQDGGQLALVENAPPDEELAEAKTGARAVRRGPGRAAPDR